MKYHLKSRDPTRTPLQWDNSAGFSAAGTKTWLPAHGNYQDSEFGGAEDRAGVPLQSI